MKIPNTPANQAIRSLVSFAEVEPGQRYSMFQESAADMGIKNYKCKIMEDHF
jgi:hypothetical protein